MRSSVFTTYKEKEVEVELELEEDSLNICTESCLLSWLPLDSLIFEKVKVFDQQRQKPLKFGF